MKQSEEIREIVAARHADQVQAQIRRIEEEAERRKPRPSELSEVTSSMRWTWLSVAPVGAHESGDRVVPRGGVGGEASDLDHGVAVDELLGSVLGELGTHLIGQLISHRAGEWAVEVEPVAVGGVRVGGLDVGADLHDVHGHGASSGCSRHGVAPKGPPLRSTSQTARPPSNSPNSGSTCPVYGQRPL